MTFVLGGYNHNKPEAWSCPYYSLEDLLKEGIRPDQVVLCVICGRELVGNHDENWRFLIGAAGPNRDMSHFYIT